MKSKYTIWFVIILLVVGFLAFASLAPDTFVTLTTGLIWSG